MSILEIVVGVAAAAVPLMAAGFAILRYVIRAETSELRANSGSTIKDAVNRIEEKVVAAAEKADTAAQKAVIAATTAARTQEVLDQHMIDAAVASARGADTEKDLRDMIRHGQDADDEIRNTISNLAEAVKVAAQSTPPGV